MNIVNQVRPDVSILMTAFNSAAYLSEAIESIFKHETSRTWELLFVDDGSTDETLAIAEDYARRIPGKIRLLTHAKGNNLGISASRNLALSHARAPRIAFLDSDDVWLPHNLETQAALLDHMPGVSMIYGGAERWVDFMVPFDENNSRAADWAAITFLHWYLKASRQVCCRAAVCWNGFGKTEHGPMYLLCDCSCRGGTRGRRLLRRLPWPL